VLVLAVARAAAEPAGPVPVERSVPAGRSAPLDRLARERLARLARDHEAALLAAALRLCGNRADADDLVQDTLERALGQPDCLGEPTRARAWLCTVLNNLFIDQCRRRRRRGPHEPLDARHDLAAPEPPPAPPWHRIGIDELRAAVDELGEEFSAVYRMHAFEGRCYDEIAAALAIPKATVGTRLLRARRKLRSILAARSAGDRGGEGG